MYFQGHSWTSCFEFVKIFESQNFFFMELQNFSKITKFQTFSSLEAGFLAECERYDFLQEYLF